MQTEYIKQILSMRLIPCCFREAEFLVCEIAFKYKMMIYWTIREKQSKNITLQCRSENLSLKFSTYHVPL